MKEDNEIVLDYGTDVKIESQKEVVEYFIWDCPKCGSHHRTIEFNVKNNILWCKVCHKETKYSTDKFNNTINRLQPTENK